MIIQLEKLKEEGIIIEKYEKDKKELFFYSVFQKVDKLIEAIIERNMEQEAKDEKNEVQEQINNVISFIGRRGSGKTSAMLSVHEFLKNYRMNDSLSFTVIDYIDASKLEKNEEILELVLANMFSRLRDYEGRKNIQERGGYENRELYQLFDEVYGCLLGIQHHSKDCNGNSPIRMLTQLSNSQTLGKKIKILVKKYLKYMNYTDNYCMTKKNHFLVIAIDDIDMRFHERNPHATPYEMLENIHRYLMIPGVIILLSYNYKDLCMGVEKHFYKMYEQKHGFIAHEKYIHELAHEYLQKIIPINTRITMSSIRKRDYEEYAGYNMRVRLSDKEIKDVMKLFEKYLCKEEQSIDLSVKKFIFLLIASKASMYYDAFGEKRHFVEPSNLRELAQIYVFFSKLEKRKIKDVDYQEYILKNLLDDLYFRYARDKLTEDEFEKFEEYLGVSIERRGRDIIQDIKKALNDKYEKDNLDRGIKLYMDNKYLMNNFNEEVESSSYSYGKLLYYLYLARHQKLFKKEMICCILNSYTIILTGLYKRIILGDKDEKEIRKRMLKIIGTSVAGNWSNLITPKLDVLKSDIVERKMRFKYTVPVEESKSTLVGDIQFSLTAIPWEFYLSEKKIEKKLEEQLHMFEVLTMFFTDVYNRKNQIFRQEGFHITYYGGNLNVNRRLSEGNGDDKEKTPKLRIEYTDACFNIMNFVKNLISGEDFFEQIHEKLIPEYVKYYNDLIRAQNEERVITEEDVKTFITEHSLWKKYTNWFKEYAGFAMPVYSFDMMYNIFKRQYLTQNLDIPKGIKRELFLKCLQKVYEGIGDLLKKEDEFYFSDRNNIVEYKFYNAYRKCPFIDYIFNLQEGTERYEEFNVNFENMLTTIAQTP